MSERDYQYLIFIFDLHQKDLISIFNDHEFNLGRKISTSNCFTFVILETLRPPSFYSRYPKESTYPTY
jgi:hypothetical protein